MKKRCLALLLAGVLLLTACQPTYDENDPNYPGTTKPEQNDTHGDTENNGNQYDSDYGITGDDNLGNENNIPAAAGVDAEKLSGLSTESKDWGPGGPKDEKNRSQGALLYNKTYGQYDAVFLKEDSNEVYLTFDEGYEFGLSGQILDTLKAKGVKAVFFITGDFAKAEPALVQRMIDEGHVVGNHSWKHPNYSGLSVEEAEQAVREMMEDHKFGASGSTVVIEECMVGPEVTVLAFCDGEHLVPMLSSQDHKRAYDGNQGPNTGGMGAFCPSPKYTPEIAERCTKEIFLPTVEALKAEGRPFKGVIYFGLMLTKDGPKVVEYNARFGDPETQPILSMLDTDLMDIFQACVDGTLDKVDIKWKSGAACCIVLASGGYPVAYEKGYPISGLEEAGKQAVVFHAGTARNEAGEIVTAGGRVLGVTAVGASLEEAIDKAYAACKPITWQDMHFRTDIGKV